MKLDTKKIREEKNTIIIPLEESLEDVEIIEWEITTLTDDTPIIGNNDNKLDINDSTYYA